MLVTEDQGSTEVHILTRTIIDHKDPDNAENGSRSYLSLGIKIVHDLVVGQSCNRYTVVVGAVIGHRRRTHSGQIRDCQSRATQVGLERLCRSRNI